MIKQILIAASAVAILSGCAGSNDYTPEAGAPGKTTFSQTCIGCHGPVSETELTTFWEIAPENANAAYVTAKIADGSMTMPSFPNIKGAELEAITQFVLEHNKK